MRLIECVPNVSEGNNLNKIKRMKDAVSRVPGVILLHSDSNGDANRTVFTFAGDIPCVVDAAHELFCTVADTVDMRRQTGEHVRNGALDVCPLIPVANVTIEECVSAARALGHRIGNAGVPVFMYGQAATDPLRTDLGWLRKGQYEALKDKLCLPEWKPDFGPTEWSDTVARCGSTQIGVRPFLVAYNVNLGTQNVRVARRIARQIRESGFKKVPGEFKNLKADGWWMASYGCAQVTMNLTDFRQTPIHRVFDRICALAHEFETNVTGSELIGLIPLDALRSAGRHYNNGAPPTNDRDLIRIAVNNLKLNATAPFDPSERIFEYRLQAMTK